ncbi:ATP-binding protein [Cypionkella psychrotolerans]|uniref:ATP-binding protein n=1 Tax=Cypionkella psychrotolerans TaxID=1678131 RepID=UPI001F389AB5|nr:ATP-binding protein [Cypionkella psychrotolerans]
MFEPFVRLDSSQNCDTGGAGLALAVTRTIIQAHGGTVQLRNPSGGRVYRHRSTAHRRGLITRFLLKGDADTTAPAWGR